MNGSAVNHTKMRVPPHINTIIVTDLDGTLLDETYDLPAAARCLDLFAARGALAVPASSKTFFELKQLNELRKLPTALICENGANIAWPQFHQADVGYQIERSEFDYPRLVALLSAWRRDYPGSFVGFADLSAAQVAEHTGLSEAAAALAKQRSCSEPILWRGTANERLEFENMVAKVGLNLVAGGRFLHVAPPADKASAAKTVLQRYRLASPAITRWLACGDSGNDQTLLDAADAAAVFPNRQGRYLAVATSRQARAPVAGVAAWRATVEALMRDWPEKIADET